MGEFAASLRVQGPWAIGLLCLNLTFIAWWFFSGKEDTGVWCGPILTPWLVLCLLNAAALGARAWIDVLSHGSWGLLIHRPVAPTQILFARASAGAVLLGLATLIPWGLACLLHATLGVRDLQSRPTNGAGFDVAVPFVPELILPGLVVVLLAAPMHLAVAAALIRVDLRWWGTRLVWVVITVAVAFAAVQTTSMGTAFGAILLLLAASTWGSRGALHGRLRGASRPGDGSDRFRRLIVAVTLPFAGLIFLQAVSLVPAWSRSDAGSRWTSPPDGGSAEGAAIFQRAVEAVSDPVKGWSVSFFLEVPEPEPWPAAAEAIRRVENPWLEEDVSAATSWHLPSRSMLLRLTRSERDHRWSLQRSIDLEEVRPRPGLMDDPGLLRAVGFHLLSDPSGTFALRYAGGGGDGAPFRISSAPVDRLGRLAGFASPGKGLNPQRIPAVASIGGVLHVLGIGLDGTPSRLSLPRVPPASAVGTAKETLGLSFHPDSRLRDASYERRVGDVRRNWIFGASPHPGEGVARWWERPSSHRIAYGDKQATDLDRLLVAGGGLTFAAVCFFLFKPRRGRLPTRAAPVSPALSIRSADGRPA